MFGLRPEHIAIIVVVAVLLFGPSRLPEIGRSFGEMVREFRKIGKDQSESEK